MSDTREMLSVGIDVGTTTTQLVFSRLSVKSVSRPGQVPRFQVSAKSAVYESPAYFTPLLSPDLVDVQKLTEIIRSEYQKAGVQPQQVETGAVIITGEIARTQNAEEILKGIASLAGDFVVTVAGPNVESLIAGRGSGAAAYSAENYTTVTNVDIGGGTSNAAIFRLGEHLSSSAMAVGGRQIVIEKTSGIVQHIAPPGQRIINALGLPIFVGKRVDVEIIKPFCDCMADLVADLIQGIESDLGKELQLSPPLIHAEESKILFISGGVGTYFYHPVDIRSLADVTIHNDVGPLLAQSLRMNPRIRKMRIEVPAETLRATVLGAASQTVTLSGSTIFTDAKLLPMRNLPVIRPALEERDLHDPAKIAEAIRNATRRWDLKQNAGTFALALNLPARLDFPTLQSIAQGVVQFAREELKQDDPLVIVGEADYAQVLGQTIRAIHPQIPLISVDQINLAEGDFIDIGEPILDGRVVPLSVKTLIFYH
ncbi:MULTISPECIES: ethanolamine ammonia-lyase reactivating factor EutA [Anaerolinea]|uniref:Ethanolamine utilization protein EutA n=1 Tax=Anaerolinea thermophila (strain DSM 14523 / JCM 11388 / NBRC 100420 / UNI-1) TaxID=926569 RepID=E8N2E6_ANATU|nr:MULTISPECIES: ethanolamine ammonia-lyase reactivating factor EutA [Anaerolinea]BAJ62752.1 ethanolamine utilization protein EutA [Anaerolinea thermophila UNI-1]